MSEEIKLRISGSKPDDFRVEDQSGRELRVRKIEFVATPDDLPVTILHIEDVELNIKRTIK